MKKYFPLIVFLLLGGAAGAQEVPRKVIAEHFTNTLCSICANRNPGFYGNLENFPEVIHIAYHPSAPYSACVFNKHNTAANDVRTHFYGQYGSTPRLVVNGTPVSSSANYADPSIFASAQGKTSPFSISIDKSEYSAQDFDVTFTLRTEAAHAYDSIRIYAAVAEDTIMYDAPNGEKLHHDVFRAPLMGNDGSVEAVSQLAGDSAVYNIGMPLDAAWGVGQLKVVIIVQDVSTHEVLQAGELRASPAGTTGIQEKGSGSSVTFYPNPASDELFVSSAGAGMLYLYDVQGRLVLAQQLRGSSHIRTAHLPEGLYIASFVSSSGASPVSRKIVLKHD